MQFDRNACLPEQMRPGGDDVKSMVQSWLPIRDDTACHSAAEARMAWREWAGGVIIAVSLCWPFLLPSLLPGIRWYMIFPLVLLAGWLRYRPGRAIAPRSAPLWALALVLLLTAGMAATTQPLSEYGMSKLWQFAVQAGIAYLAIFRQAPLSDPFLRGLRAGLFVTVGLALVVAYVTYDMYIEMSRYGVAALRGAVSLVGMPLALALAACSLITARASAGRILLSSGALLGIIVVEIMLRGRFDALVLAGLAAALMIGPPWRQMFWRVTACAVFALGAALTYTVMLPKLGDSYRYFARLPQTDLAGRSPLFAEAWQGFLRRPLGHGIGAFAEVQPYYRYPHNIILEAAYELGMAGLLCMLAIYALVIRRIWQLWCSPPYRMLSALLLITFLHILKAGDLSSFAFQWVALFLLLVVTPMAHEAAPDGRRAPCRQHAPM